MTRLMPSIFTVYYKCQILLYFCIMFINHFKEKAMWHIQCTSHACYPQDNLACDPLYLYFTCASRDSLLLKSRTLDSHFFFIINNEK